MKVLKYIKTHRLYLFVIVLCSVFVTTFSLFSTPYVPGNECFTKIDINLPTDFHLNCDSWDFMASGLNFPDHFKESNVRMSRPGYPIILSIVYGTAGIFDRSVGFLMQFYGAIFVNLLFAIGAAVILYYLCCKLFNKNVALISSLLLLLSTHFHVFLPQVHTEVAGDFVIVACLLALYVYVKKPTKRRLFEISFIIGLLMLIKFVFALPIFFGILAFRYKRLREFFIFCGVMMIPTGLWYLFVTKLLDIPFVSAEVSLYKQGTWFIEMVAHPSQWWTILHAYIMSTIYFVMDTFWVFLILPVLLAIHGYHKFRSNIKPVFVFGYVFSFTVMVFAMLWSGPRFSFGLFPIVIPLAVYGAFSIWKAGSVFTRTLLLTGALLLTIFSLSNVYSVIPNYDYNGIRRKTQVCGVVFDKDDWYC